MLAQGVPAPVRDVERRRRAERAAAVAAATRLWGRVDPQDFTGSFLTVAPQLIAVVNAAQARVADLSAQVVPVALHATGQGRADRPRWEIPARQWVGTAGDGMPTETLLFGAATHAKSRVAAGASPAVAKQSAGRWLGLAVATVLSDTARGVEGAALFARPVAGYVRMLNPPSCGRCVILAGKWFRKNQGFERHPDCDCTHIPVSEALAGDLTTNPVAYLRSLNEDELVKVLGSRANARTWLEFGQDNPQQSLNQLVNAYRQSGGIRTAQLYGRSVKYTLEGTTVRGVAGIQMMRVRELSELVTDGRYRRVVAPRLMPESIFSLAQNRDHAERLLRDHGWLGLTF